MSDTYQAVYDAVRSRIGSVSAGEIYDVVRTAFDMGNLLPMLQQEVGIVGGEMVRPSVLMRPTITLDGNAWCALYGEDLQVGVAGFGKSPADAMTDFDTKWAEQLPGG